MKKSATPLVVIEGLDGSGKSTTALQAAEVLSEAYPAKTISVADSSGLYHYRGGTLDEHRYARLVDLEPNEGNGSLQTIGKLGAFTVARKLVDKKGLHDADLLISVRDPQRIDPATYSPIYCPNPFAKLSVNTRLLMFDKLAHAGYPDSIIELMTDLTDSEVNTQSRATLSPHESQQNLAKIADELPIVIGAFERLFGSKVTEIQGLTSTTAKNAAAAIEPLLAPTTA